MRKTRSLSLLIVIFSLGLTTASHALDNDEQPSWESYHSPLQYGLFFEAGGVTEDEEDIEPSCLCIGFMLGTFLYQSENFLFGPQAHLSYGVGDDPDDSGDSQIDWRLAIFGMVAPKDFPYIRIKLGVDTIRVEEFDRDFSDSGITYGLDLAVGSGDRTMPVLSIESGEIDGANFLMVNLNMGL